ncbi:MAG: Holliday junction branch migration protein RuvA [Myxococcota bacterium]
MIARLTGKLQPVGLDRVIIDVRGVGYDVRVPVGTPGRLETDSHDEVSILIYTAVREDAISLYGFASEQEKRLFTELTKITGIGPKLGLSILSDLTPSKVVRAIRNSDIKALKQVSGIGKKTAQRLILEMKTSIDEFEFAELAPPEQVGGGVADDLKSALENMGFDSGDIDHVVDTLTRDADDDAQLEPMLRDALKMLRA